MHLGFNEIDRYAAEEIVDCLANKIFLKKLDLNGIFIIKVFRFRKSYLNQFSINKILIGTLCLGNQFGEEGSEVIKCMLETIGKQDVLGSLRYLLQNVSHTTLCTNMYRII